jgi:mono/diheme cytochrome c family protein
LLRDHAARTLSVQSEVEDSVVQKKRLIQACLALAAFVLPTLALAADAENGKRLAQARCVPCHAVDRDQARQVAQAPPFRVIAQKFGANPEMLAFSLLDPHPRMNVTLTRREAEDIAAYISALATR